MTSSVKAAFAHPRIRNLTLLILIGGASITVRILSHYNFDQSALLYVGVPFVISIFLVVIRADKPDDKWWSGYARHAGSALIIFLASSVVLFEGFVCVAMFMPIYFLGFTVVFCYAWIIERRAQNNGSIYIHVLPLLIGLSALEGTTESLSFERGNVVRASTTTNLSVAQIHANLSKPFDLQKSRHWLISIFPMPYRIDAGSLSPGDVHTVHTRYHRWFVTNTHEGFMRLQIKSVEPNVIRTRFLEDTSFLSSYLSLIGTKITLEEIEPDSTRITLLINYRRELDPAWYFHPLQQYAVGRMADFLIQEIMIRE